MEPKFQSSFIPKGPIATSGDIARVQSGQKSIVGFLSLLIFIIAVLASVGVFGYNKYLSYSISKMGADLEVARTSAEPEVIRELARLDARIVSTKALLASHTVVTPFFTFLESATLKSVRFTDFNFDATEKGITVSMKGQARGYSSVALQADAFANSKYIKDPAFSDLTLDGSGNVTFTFKANIDPSLISYQKEIEKRVLPAASLFSATTTKTVIATTTAATSTKATTTPR